MEETEKRGFLAEKKWITSHDLRVRDTHTANEREQWIPGRQAWKATGDQYAPSERDINCRCVMITRARYPGETDDEISPAKKSATMKSYPHMPMKPNDLQYFQAEFDIDAVETKDDGVIRIHGKASTPTIDAHDDIIRTKAFAGTMDEYMKNPVLLLQHDSDKPVGVVTDYAIRKSALEISAEVRHDTDAVMQKIRAGTIKAFSVGFKMLALSVRYLDKDGKERTADEWQAERSLESTTPYVIRRIREITDLKLYEISVVSMPANPEALFSLKKSLKDTLDAVEKSETSLTPHFPAMTIFEKVLAFAERIASPTEADMKELKEFYDTIPKSERSADSEQRIQTLSEKV